MNELVEECRREWKRLGVPEEIAQEMAADLEADLEEARADGVAPEEVLGHGAFDPRSFAASWATERGVSRPSHPRNRFSRASLLAAALAAFVAVAVSGAAITVFASPTRPPVKVLAGPAPTTFPVNAVTPDGSSVSVWVVPPDAPYPGPLLPADFPDDTSGAGPVLLIVGLAGTALLASFWLWSARGPGSRRLFGQPPTGSAF